MITHRASESVYCTTKRVSGLSPLTSVVTVIETCTETAVFCQTEPNRNRGFVPLY